MLREMSESDSFLYFSDEKQYICEELTEPKKKKSYVWVLISEEPKQKDL